MYPSEKRGLEKDNDHQRLPKKFKPLSRLVMDALVEDIMMRTTSDFENMLRRVVAEEVERVIMKKMTEPQYSCLPRQITIPRPIRRFQLKFMTIPRPETYTEKQLEAEYGDTIRVALFDRNNNPVTTGKESIAKLEVLILKGDFDNTDEDDWTSEEFQTHVQKERVGKGQLLVGDLKLNLRGGVGTLGRLTVMDNSSWTRSKKFRLGVKVSQDNDFEQSSVREGKSQAFTVKDIRGIGYEKRDKPTLEDQVWRLRHIAKDGAYHKKLNENGIYTVKDFLIWDRIRPLRLKEIMGKMSEKNYKGTIEHAKICVLDTLFIYVDKQVPHVNLVFDQSKALIGVVQNDHYYCLDKLENSMKIWIEHLVDTAYKNWNDVQQCTAEPLTFTESQPDQGPQALLGCYSEPETTAEQRPTRPEGISTGENMLESLSVNEFTKTQRAIEELNWSYSMVSSNNNEQWNLSTRMFNNSNMFEVGSTSQDPASYSEYGGMESPFMAYGAMPMLEDVVRDVMSHENGGVGINNNQYNNNSNNNNNSNTSAPHPWMKRPEWLRIRTLIKCALFIRNAGANIHRHHQ